MSVVGKFVIAAVFTMVAVALSMIFSDDWRKYGYKKKLTIIPFVSSIIIAAALFISIIISCYIPAAYYTIDVNKAAEKYEEMIPVKEAADKYGTTIFEVREIDESQYFKLTFVSDEKIEFFVPRTVLININSRNYMKKSNDVIKSGYYNVIETKTNLAISYEEQEMFQFLEEHGIKTIKILENSKDTVKIVASVEETAATTTDYTFVIEQDTVSQLIFHGFLEMVKVGETTTK